jgi:hypothetical protein
MYVRKFNFLSVKHVRSYVMEIFVFVQVQTVVEHAAEQFSNCNGEGYLRMFVAFARRLITKMQKFEADPALTFCTLLMVPQGSSRDPFLFG